MRDMSNKTQVEQRLQKRLDKAGEEVARLEEELQECRRMRDDLTLLNAELVQERDRLLRTLHSLGGGLSMKIEQLYDHGRVEYAAVLSPFLVEVLDIIDD